MPKIKLYAIFIMVISMSLLASCTSIPVKNIENQSVKSVANLTTEEVRDAILDAGKIRKWEMNEESPGLIVGKLVMRNHSIIVGIPYSERNYSINYRDSYNMEYNGANIHKNFYFWISELNNTIRTTMSYAGVSKSDSTAKSL